MGGRERASRHTAAVEIYTTGFALANDGEAGFAHFSSGTAFELRTPPHSTLSHAACIPSPHSSHSKKGSKSCRHYHHPRRRLQPLLRSTPLHPTTPPSSLPSTITTTSSNTSSSMRGSSSNSRSRSAARPRSVTTDDSSSSSSSSSTTTNRNYTPSVPSSPHKTPFFDSTPSHKAKATTFSCINGGRKFSVSSKRGKLTR